MGHRWRTARTAAERTRYISPGSNTTTRFTDAREIQSGPAPMPYRSLMACTDCRAASRSGNAGTPLPSPRRREGSVVSVLRDV